MKSQCSECKSCGSAWKSLYFVDFLWKSAMPVFANFGLKNQEFVRKNVTVLYLIGKIISFIFVMVGNED